MSVQSRAVLADCCAFCMQFCTLEVCSGSIGAACSLGTHVRISLDLGTSTTSRSSNRSFVSVFRFGRQQRQGSARSVLSGLRLPPQKQRQQLCRHIALDCQLTHVCRSCVWGQ
uniref:Uncharacterized protein n=1 Tax=Eutreptiella gymnastica TaxID=73025 RepID=A0A7S4FX96_9EUGL